MTTCKRGHPRTPENVDAYRACKICRTLAYRTRTKDPSWREMRNVQIEEWKRKSGYRRPVPVVVYGTAAKPGKALLAEWDRVLEAEGLGMDRGEMWRPIQIEEFEDPKVRYARAGGQY